MTMPNGPSGVDNNYYGVTADGSVPGMTTRTQANTEVQLKNQVRTSQGWNGANNTFFGGILSGFGSIGGMVSQLFAGISGLSGGSIIDLIASIVGIKSQAQLAKDASDAAAAQAQGALTAAQEANLTVTALIDGGVRTVFTNNTTWTKKEGLRRLQVIAIGAGRRGYASSSDLNIPRPSVPGAGITIAEFIGDALDALPSSVNITIGAGSSTPTSPSYTSFGSFVVSSDIGGGKQQDSTRLAIDTSLIPGAGGVAGYRQTVGGSNNDVLIPPTAGQSTALAAGGSAGGGAGNNAPVSGSYLCGGSGGGGGTSSLAFFGAASNGGAGGFPGGTGGNAGRNNNESYWVGGIAATGLCAIIEWVDAA